MAKTSTGKKKKSTGRITVADREIYQILSTHYLEYVKLFWTRQTLFITINGGFFTLFYLRVSSLGAQSTDINDELITIISLLGIVISIVWLFTNFSTRYWITILRKQTQKATKEIDKKEFFYPFFKAIEESQTQTSGFVKYLPAIIIAAWILGIQYYGSTAFLDHSVNKGLQQIEQVVDQ